VIAGSVAGSKWMSDDLFARAASVDKHFHVAEGFNHMQLYDGKQDGDDAVSVPGAFFGRILSSPPGRPRFKAAS
jgi:uncharacterized protein